MQQIAEFFTKLFRADSWPARWHCGRWTPFHGWLYIISNVFIALAYFSIPILLYYLIKRSRHNLPFQRVFWLFLLFILACGVTHVMDALMFWYPVYRMSAVLLFVTAVVSCAAVAGLSRIIPAALQLKSPAALEEIIAERTAALEKANQHLLQTNRQLEEAEKVSQKLIKQKDEFINLVSHELKTPVTSLKGYTQMITAMIPAEQEVQKNMLLKAEKQIGRLTHLINDLLDINKIQDGGLIYQMQRVQLDQVLEETVEQVQYTTKHKIIIETNEPILVTADDNRIAQVINNLLTNAIKFSPEADTVLLRLTRVDGMAVCMVKDFGLGIPADKQQEIFEKFYRIERDHNPYPGFGLGLYISKSIVLKHGGQIWLESTEDKGSCFYFSIPVMS